MELQQRRGEGEARKKRTCTEIVRGEHKSFQPFLRVKSNIKFDKVKTDLMTNCSSSSLSSAYFTQVRQMWAWTLFHVEVALLQISESSVRAVLQWQGLGIFLHKDCIFLHYIIFYNLYNTQHCSHNYYHLRIPFPILADKDYMSSHVHSKQN